jgi:hypothetical protein
MLLNSATSLGALKGRLPLSISCITMPRLQTSLAAREWPSVSSLSGAM